MIERDFLSSYSLLGLQLSVTVRGRMDQAVSATRFFYNTEKKNEIKTLSIHVRFSRPDIRTTPCVLQVVMTHTHTSHLRIPT